MTPKQRDLMAAAGAVCIAVAAFMVSIIVGFLVVGLMLLGTVYLLTPVEPPVSAGREEDFNGR